MSTLQLVHDEYDRDGHRAGPEDERVRRLLLALNHIPTRRWTYLQIARRARKAGTKKRRHDVCLTNPEFRLLFALVEFADKDLSNCFPSIEILAKQEGLSPRRVWILLAGLVAKGWIRTREFVTAHGQSTSGRQFVVPAGVLAPWADEWLGPRDFTRKETRETP